MSGEEEATVIIRHLLAAILLIHIQRFLVHSVGGVSMVVFFCLLGGWVVVFCSVGLGRNGG